MSIALVHASVSIRLFDTELSRRNKCWKFFGVPVASQDLQMQDEFDSIRVFTTEINRDTNAGNSSEMIRVTFQGRQKYTTES